MGERENIETRRQYLKVRAIDPDSGRSITVLISHYRLHEIKKRGVGAVMEAGFTVPYILQHPTAIFEGLCRDDDEDARGYGWRCYCGIPTCDFGIDGQELGTRPNKVFVVFVTDDFVAYNWRWLKCDPSDSKLPINHKTRFKRSCL